MTGLYLSVTSTEITNQKGKTRKSMFNSLSDKSIALLFYFLDRVVFVVNVVNLWNNGKIKTINCIINRHTY